MLKSTKEIHKEYDGDGKLIRETKYWENGKVRSKRRYWNGVELTDETKWDDSGNMRARNSYCDGELIKKVRWNKGTSSIKLYHSGELVRETEYDGTRKITSYINH